MNKKIFNGIFILGVITMSLLAAEKQNKRLFILTQKNMPPFSAYRRLESKGEYNQEIVFLFTNKSNKKDFIPVIYTKKKYKRLFIREFVVLYNDFPYSLMGGADFLLPENAYSLGSDEQGWITDGEYFWLNGYYAYPQEGRYWNKHWQ